MRTIPSGGFQHSIPKPCLSWDSYSSSLGSCVSILDIHRRWYNFTMLRNNIVGRDIEVHTFYPSGWHMNAKLHHFGPLRDACKSKCLGRAVLVLQQFLPYSSCFSIIFVAGFQFSLYEPLWGHYEGLRQSFMTKLCCQ